ACLTSKRGRCGEALRPLEPRLDHRAVARGRAEPRTKRPRAHSGFGAIEQFQQRAVRARGRLEHFEVSKRDLVHHEGFSLAKRPELAKLWEIGFLERLEIVEERARGAVSFTLRLEAECVQPQDLELPLERRAPAHHV